MKNEQLKQEGTTPEELYERYPNASIDHDNRHLYEGFLAGELRINRCGACATWHHPPRAICPSCWSQDVGAQAVSGSGTVALSTVLRHGHPEPGVAFPHPVVAVDLDDAPGVRYTATVRGGTELVPVGTRVVLDWEERAGAPVPIFVLATRGESDR